MPLFVWFEVSIVIDAIHLVFGTLGQWLIMAAGT